MYNANENYYKKNYFKNFNDLYSFFQNLILYTYINVKRGRRFKMKNQHRFNITC